MSCVKALELASKGVEFDERGKKVEAIACYEEARREVRKCRGGRNDEERTKLRMIDERCIERLAILDPVLKDGLAPLRDALASKARVDRAPQESANERALREMREKLDSLSCYSWLEAATV
mmetsp:Transcript_16279/g.50973  ORF Transcript_16279/g.50973 Transcript_16279/m.50973 type:complete len:121 (-) Transcript_16279:151-513(-)